MLDCDAVAGRRQQLATLLHKTGALNVIMRARSRLPQTLSVLTYHSIADGAKPGFDDGVVDATPSQFEAQLDFVSKHFTVIGIDDVIASVSSAAPLPRNPLLITFDDGYLTCFTDALPALQRHGHKATFFIATDYIENRRLYWWDRINYLVHHSERDSFTIDYPERIQLNRNNGAIKTLINLVKKTHGLDVDQFLQQLTEATGVTWNDGIERELADEMIMTWDQVRELRAAGMDVQSHTRRHRVLQTLAADQLADELRGSRDDLEQQLDEPIRALAYPVGRDIAHITEIRNAVRDAGYTIGFSNATGVNYRLGAMDPFGIRRLAVDRDASHAMFCGSLAVPPLAFTR